MKIDLKMENGVKIRGLMCPERFFNIVKLNGQAQKGGDEP